jgi:hypothetical protein
MKASEHCNEQFENMAQLKAQYAAAGHPVISMDTPKKEYLGNFYRDGHVYAPQAFQTYEHDFASFAEGIVIPHAIDDLDHNTGYINLGLSKDTSEFACDSLRNGWYHQGQFDYPQATSLLILWDGGGSHDARHYLFKFDLQRLADEIGIEIRIAHYPPYTSKYHPIEHRLCPHVTRACRGAIFTRIEVVKRLMERTHTRQGLSVRVQSIDKVYETGRQVAESSKQNLPIWFDDFWPQWNYRAVPNAHVI